MAQSTGWAGLGAGASPIDPRPQSSSHLPGTLPQGLLRPAGSARAQKGRDWHEITQAGSGRGGGRGCSGPRAWEVRQDPMTQGEDWYFSSLGRRETLD